MIFVLNLKFSNNNAIFLQNHNPMHIIYICVLISFHLQQQNHQQNRPVKETIYFNFSRVINLEHSKILL